jgi:hypothetical protein
MRYFLDTEFIEDGTTIDLISIAVVREDAKEQAFYACNLDCNLGKASPWVREHVLPQLPPFGHEAWMVKRDIAARLERYLLADGPPEIWAYYADYDWVAVCQLYGTMMDLPKGFPMFCLDVKQVAHLRNVSPREVGMPLALVGGGEHNALYDAQWTRDYYKRLMA